jgi:hypothetical protein
MITVTDLNTAAEVLTQTVEQQCKDIWRLTERLEKEVTEVVARVEDTVDAARGSTLPFDARESGHTATPLTPTNDA